MILQTANTILEQVKKLLEQLSNDDFTSKNQYLSNATIGEHTRHIIEMFQCLLVSYEEGLVNYDLRKRDLALQSNTMDAIHAINHILGQIEKQNKELLLTGECLGTEKITSNYFRELVYNIEHCIHHQALIKVALFDKKHIQIQPEFGVAPSTLTYRSQCVQ
jgi:hypothetical protein